MLTNLLNSSIIGKVDGEVAQLARAFGSYPCGQMSYRLIMAGYINWLDSSVHTRNVGGSSPSPATKWKLKSV